MKQFFLSIISLGLLCSCGGEVTSSTTDGVDEGDHRIFLTSVKYNGNLGGITGADSKCSDLATSAGLTKTYKALLSDSSSDVVNRLSISGNTYVFSDSVNKNKVVSLGSDLWLTSSTELLNVIDRDEKYNLISSEKSWSGTDSDGIVAISNDHCNDWTSNISTQQGQVGVIGSKTDTWVEGTAENCNQYFRLICISQ